MAVNDKKFHLGYLNKLVNKFNNTYQRSVAKDFDYFALNEEIETNLRAPKYRVGVRIWITKVTQLIGQDKYL